MLVLGEQGTDSNYISVLHMYEHAASVVRLHKESEPFQLKKEVRQGGTSSSKLIKACREKAFRQSTEEESK